MLIEVDNPAGEVKEASNISSFVDGLSALIERNPDQPLVNDSDKLTRRAKDVADEYLSILLEKNNQDYQEVLEILRDTERGVKVNTDVPGNYEILQMTRCMRGKLVYNAHLTYALEHYADEFPEKANVYSFLKEKGHPQKRHFSQSVYRAATVISRDNAEKADVYGVLEVDEEALETATEERATKVAQENQRIVQEDMGESGWRRLKDRLHRFGSWLTNNRKEVAFAGAVAATVVAVSIFGGRAKDRLANFSDDLQKITWVAPSDLSNNNPEEIVVDPDIFPLDSIQATHQNVGSSNLQEEKPVLNEAVDTIPSKDAPPIEPLEQVQEEIKSPSIRVTATAQAGEVGLADVSTEEVAGGEDINKVIYELTTRVDNFYSMGGVEVVQNQAQETTVEYREITAQERDRYRLVDRSNPLEANYKPNVANLREQGIPTSNAMVLGAVETVEDLKALFDSAREEGVSDIFVGSGYRSYQTQKAIYDKAPDKRWSAQPGTSQHQTGRAFDFTTRSIGFAIDSRAGFEKTPAYTFLVDEAYKYGFIRSYIENRQHDGVPDESWHYYYVGREMAKAYHNLRNDGWEGDIFDLLAWVNRAEALPTYNDGSLVLLPTLLIDTGTEKTLG